MSQPSSPSLPALSPGPSYLRFGRAAAGRACKAEQRRGVSQGSGGWMRAGEGMGWVELGGAAPFPKPGWGHAGAIRQAGSGQGCQRQASSRANGCTRCREGGEGSDRVRGSPAPLAHCRAQGEEWGSGVGGTHRHTQPGNTARTQTLPQPWGTEGTGAGDSAATTAQARGRGCWLSTTSSLGAETGMGCARGVWDISWGCPSSLGEVRGQVRTQG